MTNLIFKCEFGSRIYGTSVPTSDTDFKGIFLPTREEILLQKVPKCLVQNTKIDDSKRNEATDVDSETFSMQQYLKLLLEGQTPALDMLFCSKEHILQAGYYWHIIQKHKQSFLHKGTSQYVGYVKQQAAKYGIKGSRVNAMRRTLEFLNSLPNDQKTLNNYKIELEVFVNTEADELIHFTTIFNTATKLDEVFLEVCQRKVPFNQKIKYSKDIFQKALDNAGHRALMAEKNEGIDWKALYHSVRVARQAEELLLTHNITFPRPEKDLLMTIRKGELPYSQVAELIEEGLVKVEIAKDKSTLPEKPNFKLADDILMEAHKRVINVYERTT